MHDTVDIPLRLPAQPHECFHLAGEHDATFEGGVVERFNAESVPRGEQESTLEIVQDKRKFAAQIKQQIEPISLVSVAPFHVNSCWF